MGKGFSKFAMVQSALIIILICTLTGGAIYIFASGSLSANVEDALMEIAKQGAKNVEEEIQGRLVLLEAIARLQRIQDEAVPIEEKIRILDTEFNSKEFLRMSIASLQGYSMTTDNKKLDISDREYFQKAVHGQSNVSDPIKSRVNGELVITFSVPIKSYGKIIGVLYATYTADSLSKITDEIKMGEKGKSFIISRKGVVIAHYDRSIILAEEHNPVSRIQNYELRNSPEIVKKMTQGHIGAAEYKYGGIRMSLGYAPIRNMGWSLGVTAPKNQIFKSINTIIYFISALMFIIFFAISTITLYTRYLRRRLNREQAASSAAIDTADLILIGLNHQGMILEFNKYAEAKTLYTQEEIIGRRNIFDLVEPGSIAVLNQIMDSMRSGDLLKSFELPIRSQNQKTIHVLWNTSVNELKRSDYIEFMGVDITNRVEYEKKIHYMAYYDSVTGLANRSLLEEKVQEVMGRDQNAALLFMDIDNFKLINDSFGHTFGDSLLVEIGDRVSAISREGIIVARLAGDEFTVWIPAFAHQDEISAYAEELIQALNISFVVRGASINVSASMGIAIYPDDGRSFETLLKNSDIAMYKSKELGKRRYTFFDKSMDDAITEKVEIERSLRRALNNDEFVLYYQPQVNVNQGGVAGFEALIRWNSPDFGFVQPLRFIEIAEETGMIIDIGKWVLRTACSFLRKLNEEGHRGIHISVNVSVVQLLQKDFVEMVCEILNETGVEAKSLELEITETILMESIESNIDKIQQLMDLGIRVALDDFGKGYSSLTYLKKLAISTLKIDKAFIDDILLERENNAILDGITVLAHNLGLKVVAEGVESKEQLEYLKKCKCDMVQGFFFSRPIPAQDAIKLLKE